MTCLSKTLRIALLLGLALAANACGQSNSQLAFQYSSTLIADERPLYHY